MKEFTIKVPDYWFAKAFAVFVVILSAFVFWPYYQTYLADFQNDRMLAKAQAQIAVKQMLGECIGSARTTQ